MCSKGESCIVPVSSPHSFHTVASIFTFNKIVKKEGPLCVCPVQSGDFPFEVPRSAAPETTGLEMSLIRVSVSFNLLCLIDYIILCVLVAGDLVSLVSTLPLSYQREKERFQY